MARVQINGMSFRRDQERNEFIECVARGCGESEHGACAAAYIPDAGKDCEKKYYGKPHGCRDCWEYWLTRNLQAVP